MKRRAQRHWWQRGRPWHAMGFAAALMLACSFINWTDQAPEREAKYMEFEP